MDENRLNIGGYILVLYRIIWTLEDESYNAEGHDDISLIIIISDKRFAPFFTGDYFIEIPTDGTDAVYKRDTNYDLIMEEILATSTSIFKRWYFKRTYGLD